jgi:Na+/proline symporter
MGIGAGIFLIALGAILTFAVNWHISGLDLHAVGWVLMLAGLAGVILFFVFWSRRRPAQPVAVSREVYTEPVQPPPPPPGY